MMKIKNIFCLVVFLTLISSCETLMRLENSNLYITLKDKNENVISTKSMKKEIVLGNRGKIAPVDVLLMNKKKNNDEYKIYMRVTAKNLEFSLKINDEKHGENYVIDISDEKGLNTFYYSIELDDKGKVSEILFTEDEYIISSDSWDYYILLEKKNSNSLSSIKLIWGN